MTWPEAFAVSVFTVAFFALIVFIIWVDSRNGD